MNESSGFMYEENDANRPERAGSWFTCVIAGFLVAIFLALFIAAC